jgi:hypothetical protein
VLHYAQEIFEGMKAYRHPDGSLGLFRPEQNARRFNASARRMAMPELPEELFLESIRQLVSVDGDWTPSIDGGALCGAISTYNATEPAPGPAHYMSLLVNRASMTGFVVFDYEDRYPEAIADLSARLRDGSLVARETVVRGGVDAFGDTLLMLFDGGNTGKLVLEL